MSWQIAIVGKSAIMPDDYWVNLPVEGDGKLIHAVDQNQINQEMLRLGFNTGYVWGEVQVWVHDIPDDVLMLGDYKDNIAAIEYIRKVKGVEQPDLSLKEQLKARVQAKRARREALRKEFPNEDPIEALANLFSDLPYRNNISDKDFDI